MAMPMQMERAARILAKMKGRALAIDCYVQTLEGGPFPLSNGELQSALEALQAVGLTTSVFERLEGQMWALTELGRRMLQSQGFVFDLEEVERTRNLFRTHLSDASL